MLFAFMTVTLKFFKFTLFSEDLVAIVILWFHALLSWWDMNIYLNVHSIYVQFTFLAGS